MAKDAKGHGSAGRGGSSNAKASGSLMNAMMRTHASVGAAQKQRAAEFNAHLNDQNYAGMGPAPAHWGDAGDQTRGGGGDQGGSPVTEGGHGGDWGNMTAAKELSSGTPKSAPAPVHDSMGASLSAGISRGHAMRTAGDGGHVSGYNEHGSRHGYSPDAVNAAIASSNRSGRRIGGKEASAIHRLLKGR